jgi:hypothetical protein
MDSEFNLIRNYNHNCNAKSNDKQRTGNTRTVKI